MYMISDAHTEGFEVFLDGRRTPEPALGKPDDVNRTGDEELSHFQNFFDAIPRPFCCSGYCLMAARLGRNLVPGSGDRVGADRKSGSLRSKQLDTTLDLG
jgi:hypothetical protein